MVGRTDGSMYSSNVAVRVIVRAVRPALLSAWPDCPVTAQGAAVSERRTGVALDGSGASPAAFTATTTRSTATPNASGVTSASAVYQSNVLGSVTLVLGNGMLPSVFSRR